MLTNYFKVFLRNLRKSKGYSFINIFGLTIGLATSLTIYLFIQDELSYDTMHENAENIYRLDQWSSYNGIEKHWAPFQGIVLPRIIDRYPEIIGGARIMVSGEPNNFSVENNFFLEENYIYADSTFFDIFSFKILQGNKQEALDLANKIVITESTAIKYFGRTNVLGETIKQGIHPLKVSAVIEDVPHNSHFHFNIIVPLAEVERRLPGTVNAKGPSRYYTYIKIAPQSDPTVLQAKMDNDIFEIMQYLDEDGNTPEIENFEVRLPMFPLLDIHLHSNLEKELEANGNYLYIKIFRAVALFLVLIAAFNYMNLATAKATKRAKEVGMRKVLGASKKEIFSQFIVEALLYTLVSGIISLGITAAILPSFNVMTGKNIPLFYLLSFDILIPLTVIIISVALISGIYPALMLSKINLLRAMKSNILSGKSNKTALYLRRSLIVLQFGASVFLIIGALTVKSQLLYIQNKSLGFNKESVISIKLPGRDKIDNLETIRKELENLSNIKAVSSSSTVPGKRVHMLPIRMPHLAAQDAESQANNNGFRSIRTITGDVPIIETLGLNIIEGRSFSKDFPIDPQAAFIVNQAAIDAFQLGPDPIGKAVEYFYLMEEPKEGAIVGIVEDFHYASLHSEIEPLMLHIVPKLSVYLNVRVNGNAESQVLQEIENVWNELQPTTDFDYFFLETNYDNQYKSEQSLGTTITLFTGLAIIIACLGLYALVSFMTEQRTKEIGIRKVLGARKWTIASILSKEFVFIICFSNIISVIPAYYFLSLWLEQFVYRINLGFETFIIAILGSMLLTIATVSFKAFEATRTNPVNALRSE